VGLLFADIDVLLPSKAEFPPGTRHGFLDGRLSFVLATKFLRNRGFETLSAPASLAATLRGFTFCVAAPSNSARRWHG